jgi:glycosyltransferase involved in cell wall biosynthesis
MRITFVLPELNLSGGLRVAAIHAELLHKRGHDVTVVWPKTRWIDFRGFARSVIKHRKWPKKPVGDDVHVRDLTAKTVALPHYGPITDADLPDADVIVTTWWESCEWIWPVSKSKGVKVHFLQGFEFQDEIPLEVFPAMAKPTKKIVITERMVGQLMDRFGQVPVGIVPNSVDLDFFNAPPRGKQPVPTVGITYQKYHNKGTDVSLKAFEIAKRSIPNLQLIAMGFTPPVEEMPVPPGTVYHVTPPQEDLPKLYAAADVWLFGSREEGFGLPIIEAMACRTPVIATPTGAAPEVMPQGGGFLVPMEDSDEMARRIVEIVSMPDDRWRVLSQDARQSRLNFTWNDAGALFEKCLEKAMWEEGREPMGLA